VQTEVGFDLSIPTKTFGQVVDAAQQLEESAQTRSLTDQEKTEILEGAAYLTLNPPSVSPHAGIAVGLLKNWEVSARITAGNLRFASRYQFLHQDEDGVDLSGGLGFGFAFTNPPLAQVFESMETQRFSRWTIDVPLVFGKHAEWYRWWAGPRMMYAGTNQDLSLDLPNDPTITGTVSGKELYLGATVGVVMGYDWIFMGPELTLVGLLGQADVTAQGGGLTADDVVQLGSLIFHPSMAVMMEF
jgi:hypothetical protein